MLSFWKQCVEKVNECYASEKFELIVLTSTLHLAIPAFWLAVQLARKLTLKDSGSRVCFWS